MEKSEGRERDKVAFQTGLFDNLTVQDAFTIIALYVAQIDPENCKADLDRILGYLKKDALFDENPSDTLARLNKFVNSMEQVNSLNAIERAGKALTPDMRQKAFMLAAQIGKSTQTSLLETEKILERLASKLSIDANIVDKAAGSMIEHLLKEINDSGVLALADLSEEKQTVITKWAQEIFNRYVSVLEKHSTKIKNIVELPFSKQEVKLAIKILLTAYVIKRSDEMVDILKERYISLGAFQDIDPEDKERIIEQVNNVEQELESAYSSIFPKYHEYMEVIISEQNVLLEDVNSFINDLRGLKKES